MIFYWFKNLFLRNHWIVLRRICSYLIHLSRLYFAQSFSSVICQVQTCRNQIRFLTSFVHILVSYQLIYNFFGLFVPIILNFRLQGPSLVIQMSLDHVNHGQPFVVAFPENQLSFIFQKQTCCLHQSLRRIVLEQWLSQNSN